MEVLEKEKAWKEDDFDFVLQVLRTALLKRKSDSQVLLLTHLWLTQLQRWCIACLHNPFDSEPFARSPSPLTWDTVTSQTPVHKA